jgi:DNA-binding NarL/FixJ family response regulator
MPGSHHDLLDDNAALKGSDRKSRVPKSSSLWNGPHVSERNFASPLVKRSYVEKARFTTLEEFSVRIQHGGESHYFPLATLEKAEAGLRAAEIRKTVLNEGWPTAKKRFAREITVGVFWAHSPLCCTYTTLYTAPRALPKRWVKLALRSSRRCRTLIVHPDEGVRRALCFWVERQPGFYCTAQYATVGEALASLAAHQGHLMLVDRSLVECAGGPTLKQISGALPNLHIFGTGVYEESNYIFHSVTGVKSGYMLCRRPVERLFDPIKILSAKPDISRAALAIELMKFFRSSFELNSPASKPREQGSLTAREHDVLIGLTRGRSEKEVAADLQISTLTVHNHVKKIYIKLDVHSRTEAVVKYLCA